MISKNRTLVTLSKNKTQLFRKKILKIKPAKNFEVLLKQFEWKLFRKSVINNCFRELKSTTPNAVKNATDYLNRATMKNNNSDN